MTTYTYRLEDEPPFVVAKINAGGGTATAKMARLEGGISKLESFSTPPSVRAGGGLSYALMKILLEECKDNVVKVEGVHGYLHYTLKNLKMANGAWRPDPTYKGEKKDGEVVAASMPKQTRDYITYTPDTSLWLAMLKLIEKNITLVKE